MIRMIKSLKLIFLGILIVLLFYKFGFSYMKNYCAYPSFIPNVKSNVLLVMDYSGSMQFPAYYACNFGGYYYSKVANCGETWTEYDSNKTYYGYFNSDKYYKYNSSGEYWEVNSTCTNTDRIGSGDCISGNLLNWWVMSRIDVALKALIGGKAYCAGNFCYLKPQGSRRIFKDTNLHCKFYVSPENYSSGDYSTKDVLISVYNYDGSCAIGTFTNRYAKVKINSEDHAGIVQNNFNFVRFGFMVFASDQRYGEIRYGFHEKDLETLISKIEEEIPYYGTPTGEALWEVYDYLLQEDNHNYESNSSYIDKGTKKDPYYEELKDGSIASVWCRKNFIVLISDGEWNQQVDPVKPAYHLHTEDLRSDLKNTQSAKIFSIFAFSTSIEGENSMKTVAMFGSFTELNNCSTAWPYTFSGFPTNSLNVNYPRSSCNPNSTYNTCCNEWDKKDNNGVPDTYYKASDGYALTNALREIFVEIKEQASSGTAVSVLSTSTRGSGFISQAYFFPSMTDEQNKEFSWVGELKGLWIDQAGNIREDTDTSNDITGAVAQLELDKDKILKFYNDGTKILTHTYSSDANGTVTFPCTFEDTKELGNIISIWDIGKQLWETDPNNRDIKTTVGSGLIDFSSSNYSSLKVFLRAYDDSDAQNIINYIRGQDVDICMDSDDATCNNKGHRDRTITINGASHVWKLGDIIQSTPRVLSHFPLNTYHINYDDTTYLNFIKEHIYDPNSASPVKRNDYLFVGANDGMLHCFYLGGIASSSPDGTHPGLKAILKDPESKTPGTELWAYIPMNVLPYLKYLAYTEYCHIYYVDQRAMLLDASIGGNPNGNKTKDSWKTILIGELRFGGCSKSSTLPSDTPCLKDGQVVSCSTSGAKKVGYSSIFALDITDPENPSLLWEFSDPSLGFTTSYPTVVRFGDKGKNGNWYLIVGSGPTDYEGDYPPSEGYLFVIDLKTGDLVGKLSMGTDTYVGDCVAIDPDIDYNVNAIYCGTVIKNGSSLKGKMMRILTPDVPTVDANKNITNWDLSTLVDADAPITAAPEFTFDEKGNLWCYFGTGKYFGQTDKIDTTQQYLFGVKDTCWGYDTSSQKWKYNTSCTEVTDIIDVSNITVNGTINDYYCECEGGKVDCCQYDNNNNCTQYAKGTDNNNNPICNCGNMIVTELKNITVNNCVDNSVSPSKTYSNWNSCANFISSKDGWKRQLSVSSPAERCISKPAVIGQIAMYTTFKPNDDICGFGGDTYLYSLYYKAGIPYWQPTILRENAVTGNGQISAGVNIGKGAPPIGESISTRQVKGKTKTYVQLSTGEVVEVSQKTVFLPNKTQFWIER